MPKIFRNNVSVGIQYLSILIWPISTLLFYINNYQRRYAQNLLWLFCIFYGMIHIVFNEQGFYVDGISYALSLQEKAGYSFTDLLRSLYATGNTTPDVFMPLLTFLISRFTTDYRVLFIFLAFVYGYFYSRNIALVLNLYNGRKSAFIVLLFLTFIMVLPIFQINGRFWIGAQVFFYGVSYFLVYGKKKYLWWAFGSALIHFAHVASLAVFILYCLLPKKSPVFFWAVVATLFISSIDMHAINNLLSKITPSVFESKIDTYANAEYLLQRMETDTKSLHVLFVNGIKEWLFRIVLVIFYIKNKATITNDRTLNSTFCFVALYTVMSAIFAFVPSASRYLSISAMLTVFFIILTISRKCRTIYIFDNLYFRYAVACCLIFFVLFQIRSLFEFVGISFFISNPIFAMVFEDNSPLFYYVKY